MMWRNGFLKVLVLVPGLFFILGQEAAGLTDITGKGDHRSLQAGQTDDFHWEGSQGQKAFSEFNHRLGGLFVVLSGGGFILLIFYADQG